MLTIFHAITCNVLLNFILLYYNIISGKQVEFPRYSKTKELHLGSPVRTAPKEANQLMLIGFFNAFPGGAEIHKLLIIC